MFRKNVFAVYEKHLVYQTQKKNAQQTTGNAAEKLILRML